MLDQLPSTVCHSHCLFNIMVLTTATLFQCRRMVTLISVVLATQTRVTDIQVTEWTDPTISRAVQSRAIRLSLAQYVSNSSHTAANISQATTAEYWQGASFCECSFLSSALISYINPSVVGCVLVSSYMRIGSFEP